MEITLSRDGTEVKIQLSDWEWGWANYEKRANDGGFTIKDPDALAKVLPFTFVDYLIRAYLGGFEVKDPEALAKLFDERGENRMAFVYRADEYRANYELINEALDPDYEDGVFFVIDTIPAEMNAKYKAAWFDGLQIGRRYGPRYTIGS